MHRLLFVFASLATGILFSTAAAPASAHTTPESAHQAQGMLGPGIWSQVVEVENTAVGSRYPSPLYATVFEFDDVLWLYTGTGTQPLERSRDRVKRYRDHLLPLLQTVEPGFSSVKILPPSGGVGEDLPQLVNGCVIESIYTLEQLRRKGEEIEKAKLLLYSTTRGHRRVGEGYPRGHAVLVFETLEGRFFVDPPEIKTVRQLKATEAWNPVEFAASIEEPYGAVEIGQAFFVPVGEPQPDAAEPQFYSGER